MARKKRDAGGGYSWMDTYGDMVTLLLTFFIMLFSMSTVDENKWKVLVQAFSKTANASVQQVTIVPEGEGDQIAPALGTDDLNIGEPDIVNDQPIDLQELYEFLMAYVQQNKMEGTVTIEKDAANNVYIRFDNNIFFDGDSSTLRRDSYPIIDFMGKCLKAVEEQIAMVRVNGHTASVPGSGVNDWSLSSARATGIVTYFEENAGINPLIMTANGYGKNYPRATNDTAEGRAKNRRVEIMIIGKTGDVTGADPQQVLDSLKRMMSGDIFQDSLVNTTILDAETGKDAASAPPDASSASTPPAGSLPANGNSVTVTPPKETPANSMPLTNGTLPNAGNSVTTTG